MSQTTILIVDDNTVPCIDLQRMLMKLDYTVAGPFASGDAAIAFVLANRVDLVLMDITLIDTVNGMRTVETVHQTLHLPIVFLTDLSSDLLLEQTKTAAIYGYLQKPIAERELAATLGIALHRHNLDRQLQSTRADLTKSETKYRQLFENSPLGIFRTTLDGRALAVNAEMARILACESPEEAIADFTNLASQLYVDPERRQQFITLMKTHGTVQNFEYEGRKKNRETLWISMNASLTQTDAVDNQPGELVIDGFAVDITERKQLENVQVFLAETSAGNEIEPFFHTLARFLAKNLDMDFVCIDRLEGDGLTAQTVAVWCDGHFEDNISYALQDTPCGAVVEQQTCCYPASVCRLFPNDPVLQELRAESYAGVTLLGHTGQPIGLIAIISRQPLKNLQLANKTLKMVAIRAAGEMERLEALYALRANEKLLRDIAANIPGAMYQLIRHQDGSFTIPFISEGGAKVLGQPLEVLKDGSRFFTNIHPDDILGLWSSLNASAATMSKWRQEFRVLFANREIHWLQATSQPGPLDDGGICWNGVILDITERKQVEQNYQILFREMLNGFALHEIIYDGAGWPVDYRFLAVNPAFEHMTGLKAEDVVGRSVREVMPGIESHWVESYGRIAITGEPVFLEGFSGDMKKYFEVTAYRPAPNQFACIFADITERKAAEDERKILQSQLQQAQKMEAIGTLAGGIAHDFNNILGVVLGYAEMARDDSPADSLVAQDLNQVITASHRAKDLVKQILAFSRQAENKRIILQPSFIVKEALKMLRSSLPSTIAIHQNLAADTGTIIADPTQIHQIIMNLCTNAFHAMEESGGVLSVIMEQRSLTAKDLAGHPHVMPGDFIYLAIGDTGQGIAPEICDKIFDPFFTTKEVGKGTGMGLSIVHGIVKSYGGFVSCDSRLGKGTVFHVTLPALSGDHPLLQTPPIENIPIGSERILFVDDEIMLSEMTESMLQRIGYHVTVRHSSLEALSSFQNDPNAYDLVITDQTMPGMTGMDMARRMLQIRPDLPIILCTGYSTLISEEKAKSFGIKGFAMKPVTQKDIAIIIRKVLDGEDG